MKNFLRLLNIFKKKTLNFSSKVPTIYIITSKTPPGTHPYLAIDLINRKSTPYWCTTVKEAIKAMKYTSVPDSLVNDHKRLQYYKIVEIYTITEYPELFI